MVVEQAPEAIAGELQRAEPIGELSIGRAWKRCASLDSCVPVGTLSLSSLSLSSLSLSPFSLFSFSSFSLLSLSLLSLSSFSLSPFSFLLGPDRPAVDGRKGQSCEASPKRAFEERAAIEQPFAGRHWKSSWIGLTVGDDI
jgi:hypothetical protein